MLPLLKLRNDTLNRPKWGHVEWQPLINLQLHKPVSNDIYDFVGIGDIHGRHQVDALGVKPFFDDEGCLRKTLTACLKSGWRGNMSALLEPEVEGTGCRNATQRISPTQNGPSCYRSFPPSNPVVARARLTCVRWSMPSLTSCAAGANGGCSPQTFRRTRPCTIISGLGAGPASGSGCTTPYVVTCARLRAARGSRVQGLLTARR